MAVMRLPVSGFERQGRRAPGEQKGFRREGLVSRVTSIASAHLAEHAVEDTSGHIKEIIQAIDVLHHNPLIGRPVSADTSEPSDAVLVSRMIRQYRTE